MPDDPYPTEDEITQLAHDMFFAHERRHWCYSECYRAAQGALLDRAATRALRVPLRRDPPPTRDQ